MSWFDTKGFTSLAKTALREAQKTIDRALDIKEVENQETENEAGTEDDGLNNSSVTENVFAVTTLQPVKSLLSSPVGTALWGALKGQPLETEEHGGGGDSHADGATTPVSSQPKPAPVISVPPTTALPEAVISPAPPIDKSDWGWGWDSQTQTSASITVVPSETPQEWCEVKLDDDGDEPPARTNSDKSELSLPVSDVLQVEELETPCSIVTLASDMHALSSPSSLEVIDSRTPSLCEAGDNLDRHEFNLSNSSSLTVISPENEVMCSTLEPKSGQESPTEQYAQPSSLESGEVQLQETVAVTAVDNRSERTVSSTDSFVKFDHQSKETEARDSSPLSSERSDVIKLRSAFNSGHTSGDEIETATSSDIEVISSPGSRAPPSPNRCPYYPGPSEENSHSVVTGMQLKVKKGHRRQMSEGSSGGSDDSLASEVEKLMKRISEKNRILEARETKLLELSRINASLQEENSRVASKLQDLEKARRSEHEASLRLSEDLTRRLSLMEQKCQTAMTEKESLQRKLEALTQELSSRVPSSEVEALVLEKEQIIAELRTEGEKLSKQQLQHSNAIKKLRAKEKEDEKLLKIQKEKIEELQKESDRLKKSLSAKEDIERSQIDAVRQLTETNKAAEKELAGLRTRCSDAESQVSALRDAVEFAQRELEALEQKNVELESETAKKTLSKEMSIRQELQMTLEEVQRSAAAEKTLLLARIEDLTSSLEDAETELNRRTEQHRREVSSLMERLSHLESSQEDTSQSIIEATTPLIRQIESLEQSLGVIRERSERVERNYAEKLRSTEAQLSTKVEVEKSLRTEVGQLRNEAERLGKEVEEASSEKLRLTSELQVERSKTERGTIEADNARQATIEELTFLRIEVESLKEDLEREKIMTEQERERIRSLQEQLAEREKSIAILLSQGQPHVQPPQLFHSTSFHSRTSSPTPSLGRISVSEDSQEHTRDPWGTEDDVFESGMVTPVAKQSTVYDIARSGLGAATLLETLESQLKLKEGEIFQLQFELGNGERKRSALANEIVRLSTENEVIHDRLAELERLRPQFEELQVKYDALLTMYGEKVEEAEELRMDLIDVKEAYKIQIDQLTQR